MEDAKEKIEAWRVEYNKFRSHRSFYNLTPLEFIEMIKSGAPDDLPLPGAPSLNLITFATSEKASATSEKLSNPTNV